MKRLYILILILLFYSFIFSEGENNYIVYKVDFKKENVKFFWLNSDGLPFEKIDNFRIV